MAEKSVFAWDGTRLSLEPASEFRGPKGDDATGPGYRMRFNGIFARLSSLEAGGAAVWGSITGTLSAQTDLQSAFDTKMNSFDLGSKLNSADYAPGAGFDLYAPPSVSSFTTIIGSSNPIPSVSATAGFTFTSGPVSSGFNAIRGAMIDIASPPWTYIVRVRVTKVEQNFRAGGFGITDGTRFMLLMQDIGPSSASPFVVGKWMSTTVFSVNAVAGLGSDSYKEVYYRISHDSTNLKWGLSADGRNFIDVFTEAASHFLGPLTKIGPVANANKSVAGISADNIYVSVPYWSKVGSAL